jgi:16S rRNA (cytosine967-C5)-methyltransferase
MSEAPKSNDTEIAARHAAYVLLHGALHSQRSVDEDFDHHVRGLEPRNRGFVRLLVATTLRRLGQIDAVLATFVSRAPPERVRDLLRLGAAQLLFMDTPAYAAVGTTVALAKQGSSAPQAGMVNAVLRRVSEKGAEMITAQDAAKLNSPPWLWTAWVAAYGEPAARATAEAHLQEAALDLSLKNQAESADWAQRLGATLLPTGSLRRTGGGRIVELDGFSDGAWWVQDAAAALPAKILLHALGGGSGKSVIDLCAAPGGKTAQLAAAGCDVTAVDAVADRLTLLRENLTRLKLSAKVVTADARTWQPPSLADGVLLDAPCSATGTIRRHPDLTHLKRTTDPARFATLQAELIAAAAQMVKPGGYVLYSVCSLQPEERKAVVAATIEKGAPLSPVKIPGEAVGGESQFLTAAGELRTLPSQWPELGGLDGFYGALLQRI